MHIYIYMKLLSEGAEAQILIINDTTLKKIRLPKTYRLEQIDTKLRKFRNRREFKVLSKLKDSNVNVPNPIENLEKSKQKEIAFTFEYIKGEVLKTVLTKKLLFKAFEQIIKLHLLKVVHGDLTTLNMLVREDEVYLIDFGLSKFLENIEERAVDLNLFFNCLKNEHPTFYEYKLELLKLYEKAIGKDVLKRLEQVEMRGRNK